MVLNLNEKQIKTQITPLPYAHTWSPNCIWSSFTVIKISFVISEMFQSSSVYPLFGPLDCFPIFIQQKKVLSAKFSLVYSYQLKHPNFENNSLSLLYKSAITSISEKHSHCLRIQKTHFCLHSQTPTPASTPPNLSIYHLRQEMYKKLVMHKSFLMGNLI